MFRELLPLPSSDFKIHYAAFLLISDFLIIFKFVKISTQLLSLFVTLKILDKFQVLKSKSLMFDAEIGKTKSVPELPDNRV